MLKLEVGKKYKVKSFEQIKKESDGMNCFKSYVFGLNLFTVDMFEYCDKVITILNESSECGFECEENEYNWYPEFFECEVK